MTSFFFIFLNFSRKGRKNFSWKFTGESSITQWKHSTCKGSIEMSSKIDFWDIMHQSHDTTSEAKAGPQEAMLGLKIINWTSSEAMSWHPKNQFWWHFYGSLASSVVVDELAQYSSSIYQHTCDTINFLKPFCLWYNVLNTIFNLTHVPISLSAVIISCCCLILEVTCCFLH